MESLSNDKKNTQLSGVGEQQLNFSFKSNLNIYIFYIEWFKLKLLLLFCLFQEQLLRAATPETLFSAARNCFYQGWFSF